ncbi:hypothetical protein ACT4US_23760 [Bacillus sp. HC-Mk]
MIQTKQKGLQEVLIAAIKRATNEKTLVSLNHNCLPPMGEK